MNKNIIFGVLGIVIVVLGTWFYLTSKAGGPQNDERDKWDLTTPAPDPAPTPATSTLPRKEPPIEIDLEIENTLNSLPPPPNFKTFTVNGTNFNFAPSEIRVKKGDTVMVTFKSTMGMHDFKIDEFATATKVLRATDAEEIIEFVADKTGEFEYYCSVGNHRAMGMRGKLIVTE